MSALTIAIVACAVLAATCWIASLVTREYSWVDRAWSIVPIGYTAWFWLASPTLDPRLAIMTVLVALWGVRLTYNFARKGGYRPGGEDYRWIELRTRMSPRAFAIFNVVFVAGFQSMLLLLLTLPAWVVHARGPAPLNALDVAAAIAFVVLLIGETIADQQQWRFQCDKKKRRARGQPIAHEFLTTGLFRYSRHPNFFCEQAMWWTFWGFTIAAGASWLNVALVGPILLSLLFQGSIDFTEQLSAAKYPAYAAYQGRTSRVVPWWPRPGTLDVIGSYARGRRRARSRSTRTPFRTARQR